MVNIRTFVLNDWVFRTTSNFLTIAGQLCNFRNFRTAGTPAIRSFSAVTSSKYQNIWKTVIIIKAARLACPSVHLQAAARRRRRNLCPSRRCIQTWTTATWGRRSARSAPALGTRSSDPAARWTASTSRRRSRWPPSCRRGSVAPGPWDCSTASRARRVDCTVTSTATTHLHWHQHKYLCGSMS